MSRSESEPDSASLRQREWPVCRITMKPETDEEVTGESNYRTLRGGWGRRLRIDQPRNLGDPRKDCFYSRESDSP
jgi:hypothetical protein